MPEPVRRLVQDPDYKPLRTAAAVSAGLLFATVLVFAFAAGPAQARLEQMEKRHADLRRDYADAVLFQEQKKSLEGLKKGIPTQNDMPLLVKDLVQSARKFGLRVGGVKYDIPAAGQGALVKVSFTFPAEGRYTGIKRFLHAVETSDRLVGIQDVELGSSKGGVVELKLMLLTYVRAQEE